MLRPIPARILRNTATVKVCTGVDFYKNPTYAEYTVRKTHIQPTNEIRKTTTNTDCTLRAILFADAHISTPFEWWTNFTTSHENGGDMKVVVNGVEYTVFTVEELPDDTGLLHHWEIGLL